MVDLQFVIFGIIGVLSFCIVVGGIIHLISRPKKVVPELDMDDEVNKNRDTLRTDREPRRELKSWEREKWRRDIDNVKRGRK